MDQATFISETQTYLWRVGDDHLAAAMPKIIRTAENRIRTDLKLMQEDVSLTENITDPETHPLPADLDELSSLWWPDLGPGKFKSQREFAYPQNRTPLVPGAIRTSSTMLDKSEYTIVGKTLYHYWDGASVDTPRSVTFNYTPLLGSLNDDDDTIFNEYTLLYESAAYQEACKFLLEEERAQYFGQQYAEALDRALAEQNARKFAGSPLKMQMPRRDVS